MTNILFFPERENPLSVPWADFIDELGTNREIRDTDIAEIFAYIDLLKNDMMNDNPKLKVLYYREKKKLHDDF